MAIHNRIRLLEMNTMLKKHPLTQFQLKWFASISSRNQLLLEYLWPIHYCIFYLLFTFCLSSFRLVWGVLFLKWFKVERTMFLGSSSSQYMVIFNASIVFFSCMSHCSENWMVKSALLNCVLLMSKWTICSRGRLSIQFFISVWRE